MKNIGKIFEEDFKNSIPDNILVYRLPDAAQSFGGSSKLRFSRKNPFDFLLWNPNMKKIFALELKTVKGKSISFEKDEGESKEIHMHQINGLKEWGSYDGVVAGFVINFRELEKTIFLEINEFISMIDFIEKKSFSYNDLTSNNIDFHVISQIKKITRYKYDIEKFFNEIYGNEDKGIE